MTGQGDQPRGGHLLASQQVGGVSVNIRIGHLDQMPVCARCGKYLCGCTDAEFKGAGK